MPPTRARRTNARRLARALLALALIGLSVPTPAGRSLAATGCGTSAGYSLCLSAPAGPLEGDAVISVSLSGDPARIRDLRFAWGPRSTTTKHLLSDFEPPWGFVWRTDRYEDATGWLNVRVVRHDGVIGSPVALQVTLANGNITGIPRNATDWNSVFQPRSSVGDPVIAAVGDGGDGTARSAAVAAMVQASEASILLYLGDLYERGTPAEFDHNFGRSSLEGGGGRLWGTMAAWTAPTLGNHEAANLRAWRDYWHGRPDWDTFVFAGVRFLNLNSECGRIPGGCGVDSPQYAFARSVLETNTDACVIAYWHRPVLSAVADAPRMQPLWELLAANGVDIVVTAHTHTMEVYGPMNADLQTGEPDSHTVQLVSGAGGHHITSTVDTDPRVAWQARRVPGAAFLTAVGAEDGSPSALRWEFRDAAGEVLPGSQGVVLC